MKNLSLQDQLLNAGLVSEAKAKQNRSQKRKQVKQQRHHQGAVMADDAKQRVQQQKARQAEQDRLLNEQRQQTRKEQEIAGQITQLIESNRLPVAGGDEGLAYHFTDEGKVKTVYIDQDTRSKIIAGKLAVVGWAQKYEVVPIDVAEKISQRDKKVFVLILSRQDEKSPDNDYRGYEVPDDLMW